MKVFLTADWRNLVNLTYQIPPELLEPHLPKGLEIDIFQGHAHVSLVAFDFMNTRVKGVRVPFHVNFPEINLRFYVRYKGRRGVVFLREYVPKHCIAFIANRFYNEPYVSFPMDSLHEATEGGGLESRYRIWREKDLYNLQTQVTGEPFVPGPESAAHHFKEHEIGFGRDKKGETLSYVVDHPVWSVRNINSLNIDFDFEQLYGPKWAFLNDAKPVYQIFAEGSGVKVYHPMKLQQLDQFHSADQEPVETV